MPPNPNFKGKGPYGDQGPTHSSNSKSIASNNDSFEERTVQLEKKISELHAYNERLQAQISSRDGPIAALQNSHERTLRGHQHELEDRDKAFQFQYNGPQRKNHGEDNNIPPVESTQVGLWSVHPQLLRVLKPSSISYVGRSPGNLSSQHDVTPDCSLMIPALSGLKLKLPEHKAEQDYTTVQNSRVNLPMNPQSPIRAIPGLGEHNTDTYVKGPRFSYECLPLADRQTPPFVCSSTAVPPVETNENFSKDRKRLYGMTRKYQLLTRIPTKDKDRKRGKRAASSHPNQTTASSNETNVSMGSLLRPYSAESHLKQQQQQSGESSQHPSDPPPRQGASQGADEDAEMNDSFAGPSHEADDNGNDADMSDGDGESDDDEDDLSPSDKEESDRSRTKEKWMMLGKQKRWTENEQRIQINRLVRDAVREAFLVKQNYQAFAEPGVPGDRLRQFEEDPKTYGPKVRNTHMDKSGSSTGELESLPWNLRLRTVLVRKIMEIARECRDTRRFGVIDKKGWTRCVKERLYRIYLAEIKSRPQHPDESLDECLERVINAHKVYRSRSKKTNTRHMKCEVRAATSSIMLRRCREAHDEDGEQFWAHSLETVTVLGPDGMSEESDVEEVNVRGFTSVREQVRHVKNVSWRHPALRLHMETIDNTPGVERAIFAQTGRPRFRRVRVGTLDQRVPPQRLYRSFFRDGYLNRLHRERVKSLKIRKENLPLFTVSAS
ncbi:hypothetical protein AAF712_015689 [Marasmius tenuissimus]|uniref:Uncharacterized protein n=1 Tax=Marasmius tenuissimus TaxID=585030 RepID=A0ABR2Z9T7_9AGAR